MTKLFKKFKNPYFEVILGPFCSNLGKNEFSWKKGLCQFLNIPIGYHCAQNQKKLMSHSREKCRLIGRTDRQQWFYKTLHDRGPIIKIASLNLYQQTKNQFILLISLWDTGNFRVLQPELGTTIYEHIHLNIFQSTFDFDEFVSSWQKSGFFIILL